MSQPYAGERRSYVCRLLSCDTSVAVGSATFDGSVIFAKNSDRHANECQPLRHVPRQRHPAGSTVRCQYLEIPQVAETWELIGSRPYWLWGFEIGVNEWGLAIGNEAVHTREPFEEPAALIGMDLVRLGLERARTADEALQVIGALTERYGQGGNCRASGFGTYHNSYIIADPTGAWVLETAGHRWVARRVRDRAAISNLLTIEQEWDAASPGLVEHARAQGWSGEPFNFAEAYQDPATNLRGSRCRLLRARDVLDGQRTPVRVEDMQALLRDHDGYGGELPRGQSELPSICVHVTPGSTGETAASLVAHLRPDRPRELGTTAWVSFGSPCLGIFRPVYPCAVGLPAEPAIGGAMYDPASPWWVFERLQRIVAQAPAQASEVRTRLGALEERFRVAAAEAEAEAERLLRRGERGEAITTLRQVVASTARQAVELARCLGDELAGRSVRRAEPVMVEAWRELNCAVGLAVVDEPVLVGESSA